MSYVVQAQNMWVFPQRNSPTHDGQPDENRDNNCSEACVCSVLRAYGKFRPDGSFWEPDDIKDWSFRQGATGVLGTNVTIMNALAHFGNIPSMTIIPQGMQNGKNGLLDIEWQYLYRGIPLIESTKWIDDSGIVHGDVNHWIDIFYQTESRVQSLDSWPLPEGGVRDEDYATHYARSNQVIVVPTIGPKG